MHLATVRRSPLPYFPPAAPEPPSDELLLARMAAGDARAMGAFYDRHWTTVYALAHAILHSAGDAEDVAAGTFEQLWRSAARFDPARGSAALWVVVIARSRALDLLRARRRRVHRDARAAVAAMAVEDAGASAPDDAHAPPDVVAERRELAAAVRASLAALPEQQRRTIELAYFGGMTHTDIAATLGEPLGTVKSRIRLGMSKLRDVLRAWGPDERAGTTP